MVRLALRVVIPSLALILICALPAQADYEAGKRAWDAMRPAEALKEWRAAADAGDRRAMLALGRLYMRGLGAPQDYIEAHVWFNLAAARGEMAAVKERDALAEKMTPQQIASAQERARSWRPTGEERKQAAPSLPARATREAQGLLAKLGYKPGPADGLWGGRTARTYAGFLRDAGLPPGDKLTLVGLRAMQAEAKRQKPAPVAKAPPRPKTRPDALHRAVQAGNVGGFKAALAAGANVNARDARGWTALLHAAKEGRSQIIELLMKAGADPSLKGPKGETPVEAARRKYGTVEAARKKGEGPGVLALLEGKTWAKAMAEDDTAFAQARALDTSAAYAEYLTSRPKGRHAKEAMRLKAKRTAEEAEDSAFEQASLEGTPAAFAKFLSSYPKGRHAKKARRLKAKFDARLDDLVYGRALTAGTSAAFAEYLTKYPKGRHAKEARRLKTNAQAEEKADDEAFAQAQKAGTSAAIDVYLSSRPGGRHAEEARRLKRRLSGEEADDAAFAEANSTGTSAAYAKYLTAYPQGRHYEEARRLKAQRDEQMADDAAFSKAQKAGTSAAFDEYLSTRPGGRHAEEAQRLMAQAKAREDADDAAYAQAHKAGTSKAYGEYLSLYPKGRHSEQARRLMVEAKAQEDADDAAYEQALKERTSAALKEYFSINRHPQGRHYEEARRKYTQLKAEEEEDDAAFAKASSAGTPAAYAKYLSEYPKGRRAQEARRLKTQIEELIRKWPAGKAFRDCPDCPEMVAYPAGSFMMGSPAEDKGGNPDERPPHRVMIAKPFAVGKYEVTKSEFGAFARASGRPASGNCRLYDSFSRKWKLGEDITWREPGFEQSEFDPVVCVSWDDAKAYVKWLSGKTGQEYRLLSEAEWEYAARVGPKTKRNPLTEYFGASWGHDKVLDANYRTNCYGCISFWGGERTAPVGSFQAIRFGLYDVHGNVREWVEDCWNPSHAGAPPNGSARTSGDCSRRVVRGGSWFDEPGFLRTANRERNPAKNRDNIIGFRVARTLAP